MDVQSGSLGAEREKSLEKQHFGVQRGQNPWKNSTFGCREDNIPGKKAFWGAGRAKSLEKQHFSAIA